MNERERLGAALEPLLDRIASKEPTPGGGAVAAWVGATGCALGRMVVAYSIGRKAEHDAEVQRAGDALDTARTVLMELGEEDAAAYELLSAALKLPKDDAGRADALAPAVARAIEVPSAVAATGLNVLRVMEGLAPVCNPYLRSDLGVAGGMMEASVRGAVWMVRTNLSLVKDADRKSDLSGGAARWLEGASSLRGRVDALCRGS
jgi:formiminotetrahydrofolate cyclodeaminase